MATDQREVVDGWVEDYVFVDWGEEFRRRHAEAFPDMETPAISVGLGALGLEYIRQNGGSGYFPMRVVQPFIDKGELFLVGGAPAMQRPAYMVYPASRTLSGNTRPGAGRVTRDRPKMGTALAGRVGVKSRVRVEIDLCPCRNP